MLKIGRDSRVAKSKKYLKSGFTIVELIVVITIIGILASIAIVSYSGTQSRARMNAAVSSANQIKLKLGEFYTDNNVYPATATVDTNGASVTTYLNSINNSALATEFNTTVTGGVRKYQYAGIPAGCDNSAANKCTGFSITIPVVGWNGQSGDVPQVISN